MADTLDSFQKWALAQGTVGKATDGGFVGECVSLVNQYLYRVYGISAGAWGNAKDWATNGSVAGYFDREGSPSAGDIVVYGANYGGGVGHIGISLGNGVLLDQNWNNDGRIRTHALPTGYIAVLRRKGQQVSNNQGGSDMTDLYTERRLAFAIYGINGVYVPKNALNGDVDAQLAPSVGRDTNYAVQAMMDDEYGQAYKKYVLAGGAGDQKYVEVTEKLYKKA